MLVCAGPGIPPKMFLAGPPGSGKSSLIKAAVQLASCQAPNNLTPCGRCKGCLASRSTGRNGEIALFAEFAYWECVRPIDYLLLNCRTSSAVELRDRIEDLRGRERSLRIIHIEEAASLYRDRRDEMLTEVMDDPDFATCRWFATAVTDENLDEQFRRRWNLKITTSPPTIEDLAKDLALKCRHLGIGIDHPSTWLLLAEKSWQVVGRARALLATALMDIPPLLTRKMVQSYPFPEKDPWNLEFFGR